jgi:uncharacterized RDD family membrane protein YckC
LALLAVVLPACCTITGVGVAVMNSGQRRGGIFISYRREETAGQAGRLYDRLSGRFGPGRVFMDVDSIAIGVDFTTAITEAVSGCDILLALIGREWLSITDAGGRRRIDDPDDFVRVEIEAALQRDIRVVPVLVEGAVLPQAADLPPSLRLLVRRQALMLSHVGFGSEVSRLIAAVDAVLGAGPGGAAEAGGDTDRAAATTGPPAGKPHAGLPVNQEEPDVARGRGARSGLAAADDPAYVDGLSALLAGRFDEAVDCFTALQDRFPGDLLVQERLQKALLRRDCALWYNQGVAAAELGDWDQAVAAFERVPAAGISDTDAYADTAERLSQARWQLRRHGLIDDVRRLHAAGQWEAAIAAGLELEKFDPATPDPDGLITESREALAEKAFAARYATGLQQFDSQDWLAALDTFTGIEHERSGYRDTPALLGQLQQRRRAADLERRYAQARAFEDREEWTMAARGYSGILKIDPAYRDAEERLNLCRRRNQISGLQSKLDQQEAAEDWPQVLASIKKLTELDPAAARPSDHELAARARRELAAHPGEPLRRIDVGDRAHRDQQARQETQEQASRQAEDRARRAAETQAGLARRPEDARRRTGRQQVAAAPPQTPARGPAQAAPPKLELSSLTVDFGRIRAGSSPKPRRVKVRNAASGDLNARIASAPAWIGAQLTGGTLILKAQPEAPGSLIGDVLIDSDGGSAKIRITATIESPSIAMTRGYYQGDKLATWWQRVGAYIIDWVPAYLVALAVARSPNFTLIVVVVATAIWLYNRCYLQGRTGQSWGKRVMGLKLIRMSDKETIGSWKAAVRDLAFTLDILDLYLLPIWDSRRQTLADKAMKTVVISLKP